MNYVIAAFRYEREQYQLNQPPMSDGKKWQKNMENHLDNIWDLCFPKLQSYAKLQNKRKKRIAERRKAKIRAINEGL